MKKFTQSFISFSHPWLFACKGLGLVAGCLSLVACLGKQTDNSTSQAAAGGPKISSLHEKFNQSNLGELINMDSRYIKVDEKVSNFSMAGLGEGAQAKYFQDSRYGATQESSLTNQRSSFGSQRAYESSQQGSWQDRRFADTQGNSRAQENSREFSTAEYADGSRRYRSDGKMSRLDGRSARGDGQRFQGTQKALETPRIPNVIGSLSDGAYMGQEQVRALTQ